VRDANVGVELPLLGRTASVLIETHRRIVGASHRAFMTFGRALMRRNMDGQGAAASFFSAAHEAHLEFCRQARAHAPEGPSGFSVRRDDWRRQEP